MQLWKILKMNLEFEALGTKWLIKSSNKPNQNLDIEILKKINDFENTFSRFNNNSLISNLKNIIGVCKVNEDFTEILKIYFEFENLSEGKFTPLIGENLERIGYDRNYSFKQNSQIIDLPRLSEAIEVIDENTIKLKQKVNLDFGAIGKGFLVDKVADFLKNYCSNFYINAGGDIYYFDILDRPLEIFLENPLDSKKAIAKIQLPSSFAICGSSNNRRKWYYFSHIIGSSEEIIASWAIHEKCSYADALSTCLMLSLKINYMKSELFILDKEFNLHNSNTLKTNIEYY
jgi:thiamine biosynthesis lipoprotein